jgi:ABC-type nitrate/sulfonate/bicarbonate transport system permease component
MREGLGLGYYVWVNYDNYGFYDNMVAGMLLIGFIGWLMNFVIQKIEKYIIKWQE